MKRALLVAAICGLVFAGGRHTGAQAGEIAPLIPPPSAPPATTQPKLAAPATTPTIDEMLRWLDAGKAGDVIQQIVYIQASKKLLDQYDPYELWMLKAEACLSAKNKNGAVEALQAGAKEAKSDAALAYAVACAFLINHSTGLTYVPQPTQASAGVPAEHPAAIDITDRTQRKAALQALFRDQAVASKPVLDVAMHAHNLPDMASAVQTVSDLEMLELAATGATKQMQAAKKAFLAHMQEIVGDAIKIMRTSVDAISRQANAVSESTINLTDATGRVIGQQVIDRKRGLAPGDANSLRETIATCSKIEPALTEIAKRLRVDAGTMGRPIGDAKTLGNTATTVLNTDYTVETVGGSVGGFTPR